ncbi:MAG: hypothetical protein A3H88_03930 [Candidatus Blackburnbacteria bacterium RIFCSPLOWO2_02_FULL_44_9]|uniref:Uncharacterized protein n=1 Tax=Candidatus Blackburnbacteria bacterium RIFCSPHIGHO2_02_FULL_44_20 TaxID=1797516 RepID=A0A1G1V8V4_9BACT|nr:MAG: hypothetical protein A3E16_00860 [Candidatus Blackburnbacteria bacterium RIFCSPHIGHO2_12_FULL_44_25]OGY11737.1 MAG: hypothetical protein A3D26_02095 [Candidatus Blackburnbacteria bacterium RIFCSPHIGHO2_02_FULL_44_20]OGY14973.1 MAG: hypothetical protein A3A62_02315 [Candidatus Blackburnbacteria bacterium RIFCSPLOWO2_01_FULL_44_43]OGY15490.1 MAG: hypothetical protein A3H88_03930 [Candidatus Blackburnbacteria bacterium RIFCSPLOWO2_02_FULL_44_9]
MTFQDFPDGQRIADNPAKAWHYRKSIENVSDTMVPTFDFVVGVAEAGLDQGGKVNYLTTRNLRQARVLELAAEGANRCQHSRFERVAY